MRAVLSHGAALQYWRTHFPIDSELGEPCTITGAEAFAHRKREVLDCIPEAIWPDDSPIDIMVFNTHDRGWSHRIKYHVWSTSIPDNAFYRIGKMLVSSPEFVYLQMAGDLTVAQLAALGCELCGTYILQPRSERLLAIPDDAPRRRSPLTSTEKLASFLRRTRGTRHLKKAVRALQHVVNASRSPMETTTMLQLCLPPRLGGYGIPHPVMNPVIPLDSTARKIAGKRWCEGDACWIGKSLDVEYNGTVHAGTAQMKSDAGRVIALQYMGWNVITITSAQVLDIEQFEAVAIQIAKHIGHRVKTEIRGYTPARIQLHEELAAWLDINA